MTRDEAITKLYDNRNSRITASDLDLFVALGMLKLDEPDDRAYRVLKDSLGATGANDAIDLLLKNGFQIIEKQGQ